MRRNTSEILEIDREALQRLEAARTEGETFSEVIKRCVPPRQSADDILRTMRRATVSAATLESIEKSAARRRKATHKEKG